MTTQEKIKQLKETILSLEHAKELKELEIKKLREKLKKKNIFERRTKETYFFSNGDGGIGIKTDHSSNLDDARFEAGNYCRDRRTMEKRAEQETLSRLVWQWQKINDRPVDDERKYFIVYNEELNTWETSWLYMLCSFESTFFTSEEKALECIEEVVKPFIRDSVFREQEE